MKTLIHILRSCLFLIEALAYHPRPEIRANRGNTDRDQDTDEPLFL